MRNLNLNEIAKVSGGEIGDRDEYTFALFPGEKVVGVQMTVIGYEIHETLKKGFFIDTIIKEYIPIYDVEPIIKNAYYY